MNKQKNNKILKKSILFILIILIIFSLVGIVLYIVRRFNYINLTQFSSTTSRQMMGYAIKTVNNKMILIDGGTTDDADQLKEYIKGNGNKVETWFVTHPHSDHIGVLEQIIKDNEIEINKIYISVNDVNWYKENETIRSDEIEEFLNVLYNSEKLKDKIIEPQIGDTIRVDNVKIEILGIRNPEITTNAANNSSMIIKMKVNNKKILFLGDTGVESSLKVIKNQGKNLKADIVQVAHHGQAGATEELYNLVKPQICLWPTTAAIWNNNAYGQEDSGPWKTKETRNWMNKLNVKMNYVAKDGNCTIKIF